MTRTVKTSVKLQAALCTVGCFMAGAPMPPPGARRIVAVLVLTNYPIFRRRSPS